MTPTIGEIRVLPDQAALAEAGAALLAETAAAAGRRCVIGLAGGSTPRPLYQRLAAPPYRTGIDWGSIDCVLGDERFVAPEDPDSNFGMIRGALLDRLDGPKPRVHPVPFAGLTVAQAAQEYERTLRALHGTDRLDAAHPFFDLCLLGMGDDGHTASLLPGQPLLLEERDPLGAAGHRGTTRAARDPHLSGARQRPADRHRGLRRGQAGDAGCDLERAGAGRAGGPAAPHGTIALAGRSRRGRVLGGLIAIAIAAPCLWRWPEVAEGDAAGSASMSFKVQVGPPQISIHQGQTVLVTEPDGQISLALRSRAVFLRHPHDQRLGDLCQRRDLGAAERRRRHL